MSEKWMLECCIYLYVYIIYPLYTLTTLPCIGAAICPEPRAEMDSKEYSGRVICNIQYAFDDQTAMLMY